MFSLRASSAGGATATGAHRSGAVNTTLVRRCGVTLALLGCLGRAADHGGPKRRPPGRGIPDSASTCRRARSTSRDADRRGGAAPQPAFAPIGRSFLDHHLADRAFVGGNGARPRARRRRSRVTRLRTSSRTSSVLENSGRRRQRRGGRSRRRSTSSPLDRHRERFAERHGRRPGRRSPAATAQLRRRAAHGRRAHGRRRRDSAALLLPPISGARRRSAFATFIPGRAERLQPTATALPGRRATAGTSISRRRSSRQGDVTCPMASGEAEHRAPVSGVGLSLAVDQIVDFAGLHASGDPPLRFAYFPTPPLVPQDGFESATGAQVGGATVVSDGPLPPITGARSLYLGPVGVPAPSGVAVGAALHLRLAVQPGDTTLRFSYRVVSFQGRTFAGRDRSDVGSGGPLDRERPIGATPPAMNGVVAPTAGSSDRRRPDQGFSRCRPDVTGEGASSGSRPRSAHLRHSSGTPRRLLIDDLRIE